MDPLHTTSNRRSGENSSGQTIRCHGNDTCRPPRRYLQDVSDAVSGPRTAFNHKQLCRRFVLAVTTGNQTTRTPLDCDQPPQSLAVVEDKTGSSRDSTPGATRRNRRCSCLLNNDDDDTSLSRGRAAEEEEGWKVRRPSTRRQTGQRWRGWDSHRGRAITRHTSMIVKPTTPAAGCVPHGITGPYGAGHRGDGRTATVVELSPVTLQ